MAMKIAKRKAQDDERKTQYAYTQNKEPLYTIKPRGLGGWGQGGGEGHARMMKNAITQTLHWPTNPVKAPSVGREPKNTNPAESRVLAENPSTPTHTHPRTHTHTHTHTHTA